MISANEKGRQDLAAWKIEIAQNVYTNDHDLRHSVEMYLRPQKPNLDGELSAFGEVIPRLEAIVSENNAATNLPRIEHYNGIGALTEDIIHHPAYEQAGNIIYSSRLLERMSRKGGLLEALCFMFISSQAGEAGHNCPVACSAGIIRVLQKTDTIKNKDFYIHRLINPFYTDNYTGAQFLTEVQGGSDVGLNATQAYQEDGQWKVKGEKWFCSNADAELILMTARFDPKIEGTKGLGLFLVPATLENGERNHYTLRRLKDKIGTRSMASGEIDFNGAIAYPVGPVADGFKLVMENVLHISRLFNTFCMIAMARRAFSVAHAYAKHRVAFGHPIINYPLVKDNLAKIKVENTAFLASAFATAQMQDDYDTGKLQGDDTKLLLRLLANLNKYGSALWSVEHIHHALDTLAGNGAIETFSTIPRLLRDSIVCENWEGTHNTLRMQILRDILKYGIDELFIKHIETFEIKEDERIVEGIKKLKHELKVLKQMSPELQSLQIKKIVDLMVVLHAAVFLFVEAVNQAREWEPTKSWMYELFAREHLSEIRDYDAGYLDLIAKVLQ